MVDLLRASWLSDLTSDNGVRIWCAASAMKVSVCRKVVLKRAIKPFSDRTRGANSSGVGCLTGRKSLGPRRLTASASNLIGRRNDVVTNRAIKMAKPKKLIPMMLALREISLIIFS